MCFLDRLDVMPFVWQLPEQLWALPGSLMQQSLEELIQKLLCKLPHPANGYNHFCSALTQLD